LGGSNDNENLIKLTAREHYFAHLLLAKFAGPKMIIALSYFITGNNKYGGGVFGEINIKKPSLLRQIMDMLDPLILSDIKTDIKGDAFEYFLKNMNQADNDLGQYFTPRHIVKAMVRLVNPKFKETIYDPFCGTGGFLTESFNHIKENAIIETEEEKKILKEQTLFGRDATKVSTIAKKNMILHGDGHSNIQETDSLENPIIGKRKCIITNIPFSLKDVDYSHLYYNSLAKKNGDGVCVLHCLQALEEGGRMAIIVPEGFLFKKELKEVRKFLLSKANLELVVSLPQGVFQPYTGVKTDILYLTNAHKPEPNREGYYYFEVKNDGYSLDSHRRKLEGANDIYKLEATSIKKTEKELLIEQGFEFIPFEKIKENDYNLVGTRYREIQRTVGKWEMVLIKDLIEKSLIIAKKGRTITKEKTVLGNIPVIAGGQTSPYSHNEFTDNGNIITISSSGAYSGYVWYHNYPIWASDCSVFYSNDENKLLTRYFYYVLKHQQAEIYKMQKGAGQPHIYIKDIETLYIPLPPLEEKEKIVASLDQLEKSIKSAQELIENLRVEGGGSFLHYSSEVENFNWIKIGELFKTSSGGTPQSNTSDYYNGDILWFQSGELNKKDLFQSEKTITEFGLKNSSAKIFPTNTILVAMYGATAGQVSILRVEATTNQAICGIFPNEKIMPEFLYYFLASQDEELKALRVGGAQPNLTQEVIKQVKIPLPPLHIQEEIVAEMEEKENFIKQAKEIIAKQKQRRDFIVSKLWKV
jgi:type I restriction enzyme M protein